MKSNLIIAAEAGSNWRLPSANIESSHDFMISAIRSAHNSGANVFKIQLFRADRLYSQARAPEAYAKMLNYEFPYTWLKDVRIICKHLDMGFWASVFDEDSAREAAKYVDVLKIASGDLTNHSLLRVVAHECRLRDIGMGISTGAATGEEVAEALSVIGRVPYTILFECVSAYPALATDYNLLGLSAFRNDVDRFGLSDHTTYSYQNIVAQLAVGMGYTYFEKHFTPYGADTNSPDYEMGLNPTEFRNYVNDLHCAEQIVGNTIKQPREHELPERIGARRGKDGLRPAND